MRFEPLSNAWEYMVTITWLPLHLLCQALFTQLFFVILLLVCMVIKNGNCIIEVLLGRVQISWIGQG